MKLALVIVAIFSFILTIMNLTIALCLYEKIKVWKNVIAGIFTFLSGVCATLALLIT